MKVHNNIAIFIPHKGCPNQCSFCDQKVISSVQYAPTSKEVIQICQTALEQVKCPQNTEIAFFGGSFTAIERSYMIKLLECVQPFIGDGKFSGIRISTRPDKIYHEILSVLKYYNVSAIELGAQSMNDEVLIKNERGHTSKDVCDASKLIKEYGFSLGLQMMVGLYGSSIDLEYETINKLLLLSPDTMRIYPVAVLDGTKLAEYFRKGIYILPSQESVLDFCADALCMCYKKGVKVIRCGLHAEESVSSKAIAGFYHQAWKELVESKMYRRVISFHLKKHPSEKDLYILVSKGCISKVVGHKKCNRQYFENMGISFKIKEDIALQGGQIHIGEEEYNVFEIAGIAGI